MHSKRSIARPAPVKVDRLHGGRPVLEPKRDSAWESSVVLNPAAVLLDDISAIPETWQLPEEARPGIIESGALCIMLYRAQGSRSTPESHAPSALGFAVLTPDLQLIHRRSQPVIQPEQPFENLGVEDPRCTKVGDTYYLYYTGYGRTAGADPSTRICLATSQDLVSWEKHGPLSGELNIVPNKNAALFPEPVQGKWLLLHRPMEGEDAMTIHWAESEAPDGPWRSRDKLMESYSYREFERSWIGAGGPPLPLGEDRFLMIYHQGHFTQDGLREYDLAAALLDFRRSQPLVSRIEPLMRPSSPLEQKGDPDLGVDNVLFTCANYVWNDELIIPYAGADSRIFGAGVPLQDLVSALEAIGRLHPPGTPESTALSSPSRQS